MATLPSYQDAVRRGDWLALAAPYTALRDAAGLSRVSTSFYRAFAPRLWSDPVRAARRLGLGHDDGDAADGRLKFLDRHVGRASPRARALVRTLDLRAVPAAELRVHLPRDDGLADLLRTLPAVLPRLRCILLDGQPADASPRVAAFEAPLMLSLAHCPTRLPLSFFATPYMAGLIYLDVSDIPGPLFPGGALSPQTLPNLRILKARRREVDGATAGALFGVFTDQLWSIDLGQNPLGDGFIDAMLLSSFPAPSLSSGAHFAVEGRLRPHAARGLGFDFVEESRHSAGFAHPDRYLADAPGYVQDTVAAAQETDVVRANGSAVILDDSADAILEALVGSEGQASPTLEAVQGSDCCRNRGGITHLSLDGTRLTADGLLRILSKSRGYLEHLRCDRMLFSCPKPLLPKHMVEAPVMYGILGAAHLFRPVYSANLQVLRIHHSLVTRVLSLEAGNLAGRESAWLAERYCHPRATIAYPQAYVPDMNPRLLSLTLTRIPRYSCGPVIDAILDFLRLASLQERAIQEAPASSRRGPLTLRGLRHIRLDFEDVVREPTASFMEDEGIDTGALLDSPSGQFSFFADSAWSTSPSSPTASHPPAMTPRREQQPPPRHPHGRLGHFPYADHEGEYLHQTLRAPAAGSRGEAVTVPVWIGPGTPGPHPAVNEYMRQLRDPALHTGVAPASPCHVAAGVPAGACVFGAAWGAVLAVPAAAEPRVDPAAVRAMRDVAAAVRDYRHRTRAAFDAAGLPVPPPGPPHCHWTGRLELALQSTTEEHPRRRRRSSASWG
ncbi:hypothetical protein P8C59_005996 [Phyllachora maydis]|uniref:Uncharacterized protein n=1 Tax=Phyllachora maydis TaxID=1825666 RepID=A0AAD9I780_9PEZI|nr:hypothetical protein P8C59_005996 [Phyllachora maydis]